MKVDLSPEEAMQLFQNLAQMQAENLRLQEQVVCLQAQVRQLKEEGECYKAMAVVAQLKEQLARQGTHERVIPVSLENLHTLVGKYTNAEVSLLIYSLIQLLPEGSPGEMVKMIADAAPVGCLSREGVNFHIENARDVVTGGGTKNVTNNELKPTDGGHEDDQDRNCIR